MPEPSDLLDLLRETAAAVGRALADHEDWGLTGGVPGQHHSDLVADEAALGVLSDEVAVLSEESGLQHEGRAVTVVVDPLDGSTNAAHGIPWYATSLCAVDVDGPAAALVMSQADGATYWATRGGGAHGSSGPLSPSGATALADSLVGLSGFPGIWLGWRQFRALGAAALDLCAVAAGITDAYLDCSWDAHGVWDYLAGALICSEAGAVVGDARGRELLVLDHAARRTPIAAATPQLFDQVVAARARVDAHRDA